MDLKVTYWMMFQHMLEDFVHKDDLKAILAANVVNATGGNSAGPVQSVGKTTFTNFTDVAARGKNLAYKAAIKAGGAVRKGAIEGVETGIGIT